MKGESSNFQLEAETVACICPTFRTNKEGIYQEEYARNNWARDENKMNVYARREILM